MKGKRGGGDEQNFLLKHAVNVQVKQFQLGEAQMGGGGAQSHSSNLSLILQNVTMILSNVSMILSNFIMISAKVRVEVHFFVEYASVSLILHQLRKKLLGHAFTNRR